jgi:uncharacterized protein (DUF2252 family)
VQSQTSQDLVLRADMADRLRQRLAAYGREALERAWDVVSEVHSKAPPLLQLEERVTYLATYLSLNAAPETARRDATRELNAAFERALVTMAEESRAGGTAEWAARALPRLPPAAAKLDSAAVLALAASARLGTSVTADISFPSGSARTWLPWVMPAGMTQTAIGVRLLDQGMEVVDPSTAGAQTLYAPKTSPVLLEVSWGSATQRSETVRWSPGQTETVSNAVAPITIQTLRGDIYRLEAVETAPESASASPSPTMADRTADYPSTFSERLAAGKSERAAVPRSLHAIWKPPANRPDPIALLEAADRDREPDLLSIRYGRMLASPFAFLRGAVVIMAHDLASTPTTSIRVQANGDAQIANFAIYDTPEGNVVFDLRDFDESLPGPWEWDLKRLATSIAMAGRSNGLSADAERAAVLAAGRSYRERLAQFARMGLAVWSAQIDAHDVLKYLRHVEHDHPGDKQSAATELGTLTHVVDGKLSLVDDPPLLTHGGIPETAREEAIRSGEGEEAWARTLLESYQSSLREDHRELLARFAPVDVVRSIMGIAGVGTRRYILLLRGRSQDDQLFLQVKEATISALERYLPPSAYPNHGQRVVNGQQRTQATPDMFLGWGAIPAFHYYVRQLRPSKAAPPPKQHLQEYAALCGWALARAHARTGDPAMISGYIGQSERFDEILAAFAHAYADQTERDYETLIKAVKEKRLTPESGV